MSKNNDRRTSLVSIVEETYSCFTVSSKSNQNKLLGGQLPLKNSVNNLIKNSLWAKDDNLLIASLPLAGCANKCMFAIVWFIYITIKFLCILWGMSCFIRVE